MQAGHQDHRRRLGGETQADPGAAHQLGQLAVNYTDQRLAGGERADDFLADGFFLDAGDEFLHHRQGDVGFEQRHAHFAQHLGNIIFAQARLAAQRLDDLGQA